MRKSMPSYLSEISSLISDLESDKFCSKTIENSSNDIRPMIEKYCSSVLNGMLNRGISKTFAYMYAKSDKIELDFDSSLHSYKRNITSLKKLINDNQTLEILDAKTFIMSYALEELKEQSLQSTMKYFEKLKD